MIRRFFCWLGVHRPPSGIDPEWSLYWTCRCGTVCPGDLARRRR